MKISIILITYNRPNYLKISLKSALDQTIKEKEIIVIDNSDEIFYKKNEEIINQYSNIRYYWLKKNYGAQYARNFGIKKATGDYVAFLDDDDRWLPYKLEKQVKVAIKETAGLVSCLSSHEINYTVRKKNQSVSTSSNPMFLSYKSLLNTYVLGTTSTFLINKSILEKIGGFDESFPAAQDHELGLRMAKQSKVFLIPEILNIYQTPPKNHIGLNYKKRIEGHIKLYKRYSSDYELYGFQKSVLLHGKFLLWLILLTSGFLLKDKTKFLIRMFQKISFPHQKQLIES